MTDRTKRPPLAIVQATPSQKTHRILLDPAERDARKRPLSQTCAQQGDPTEWKGYTPSETLTAIVVESKFRDEQGRRIFTAIDDRGYRLAERCALTDREVLIVCEELYALVAADHLRRIALRLVEC